MEEKTHAPGEGRRERVCALRRPFEAAEGLVPVAADLVRLADELLDGGGAKLGRKTARRVEHGVDGPLEEKRTAVGLEQARRLGGLDRRERPQRLLRLVTALEPPRGGDPHLAHVGSTRGEPGKGELAHGRAERVPPGLAALELDEEPATRERSQRLVRSFDPECVAELRGEAVERRDARDELSNASGSSLANTSAARYARSGPPVRRMRSSAAGMSPAVDSPQGLHGEADSRGPAAGEPVELGGDGRVRGSRELHQQRRRLVDVECELRPGDLQDLPLPSAAARPEMEARHGTRRRGAGAQVPGGRAPRSPGWRLPTPRSRGRRRAREPGRGEARSGGSRRSARRSRGPGRRRPRRCPGRLPP